MVAILLADDHRIVRHGLIQLLRNEGDLKVTAEVSSGFEVMRWCAEVPVDVAVVDISMPGPEPAELLAACRKSGCNAAFVALTMHSEATIAQRVLRAGFLGYVHKDDAFTDLLGAIRAAANGISFCSSSISVALKSLPEKAPISEREQHVLRCIADGMTNKRTAVELGISIKTVETYRSRLMKKLDVHSAAELIRVATQQGWL